MWMQAVAIILPRIQQHYSGIYLVWSPSGLSAYFYLAVPDNYIGAVSSSMFAGMMFGAIGWGTCMSFDSSAESMTIDDDFEPRF